MPVSDSKDQWFPSAETNQVVGRFRYHKQEDIAKSIEADEKVYRMIIVLDSKPVGGDLSTVPVKPFNEISLRKRFPGAWAAFQGEEVPIAGTPLTEMGYDDDRILGMKIHSVYTVEQLAALSDAACASIGFGTRKERERAQEMLKAKAEKQNGERLAALEQRVAATEATQAPAAANGTAEPKAKRGRPRKSAEAHSAA